MKKLILGLVLAVLGTPAWAQSSFVIKDGAGASQTVKSIDCAATICPISVPVDTSGAAIFTSGSAGYVRAASGAFASGALASGSVASGAMVDLGAQADAACATDNGTCSLIALSKRNNQLITSGTIPTGTAGTPSATVLTVQGVTSMTPLTQQPSLGTARATSASVSFAASGDNTVVTRATGTIKIYRLLLACASSVVVTIKDGAGTSLTGAMTMTSMYLPMEAEPHFATTGTNNFVINLGSAVQCSGRVYYLDN